MLVSFYRKLSGNVSTIESCAASICINFGVDANLVLTTVCSLVEHKHTCFCANQYFSYQINNATSIGIDQLPLFFCFLFQERGFVDFYVDNLITCHLIAERLRSLFNRKLLSKLWIRSWFVPLCFSFAEKTNHLFFFSAFSIDRNFATVNHSERSTL